MNEPQEHAHARVEKNVGLMAVLIALVISLGGLAEIVPLMFVAETVEPVPGVAFAGIVTGQDLVAKSNADLIAESTAVAVAGGLVLVLAALGIVGVVGFMVATRTREIAVRMALGCTRLRVFGLMLLDIVKLVIPGIAGGLLLAAVLIRTMENVMGTPLTLGPAPLGVMEPLIYASASAIAVARRTHCRGMPASPSARAPGSRPRPRWRAAFATRPSPIATSAGPPAAASSPAIPISIPRRASSSTSVRATRRGAPASARISISTGSPI